MKSQIQWDMEIEYKYNAIVERKLTPPRKLRAVMLIVSRREARNPSETIWQKS